VRPRSASPSSEVCPMSGQTRGVNPTKTLVPGTQLCTSREQARQRNFFLPVPVLPVCCPPFRCNSGMTSMMPTTQQPNVSPPTNGQKKKTQHPLSPDHMLVPWAGALAVNPNAFLPKPVRPPYFTDGGANSLSSSPKRARACLPSRSVTLTIRPPSTLAGLFRLAPRVCFLSPRPCFRNLSSVRPLSSADHHPAPFAWRTG